MNTSKLFHPLALCAAAALLASTYVEAGITCTATQISRTEGNAWETVNFPAADLTAHGITDWAYWNWSSTVMTETNGKSGGTAIGLPTLEFSTVAAQCGSPATTHFSFTDGTSPTSGSNVQAGAGMQSNGNNQPTTISFTVPVTTDTSTLRVWFTSQKFNSVNISVWNGATQIGSTIVATNTGDKRAAVVYRFDFGGADSPGTLTFKFSGIGRQQDDSQMVINAAALDSNVVTTPTFNPTSGIYASAQSVTISTPTSGANIYYTTDDSTPTESSTLYTSPVNVNSTMTLKAIAFKSGATPSSLASAGYVIGTPATVGAPVFSPVAGTYTSTQSVTITTATSGAAIRYTTDGSDPTSTTGTLYSTAISVATSKTLKAIAYKSLMADSAVAAATYTINGAIIPGKIEAESYVDMNGVQKENTSDAGGGQNVGYIDTNEWMDYYVNVQTAGTYDVKFRVARAPSDSGQLQLKSGATLLATVAVPSTGGWQTWTTVTATGVALTAGNQTLRVHVSNGGWNFNWMDFTQSSASGYSTWSTTHFGASASDPLIAGDNADPNTNGIANLMEYALGGDPSGSTTGQAILPDSGTSVGNRMTLTFQRDPSLTDINYIVEVSENLIDPWTPIASSTAGAATVNLAAFSVTETGSSLKSVVVEDTSVINSTSKRFIRLRVVRP